MKKIFTSKQALRCYGLVLCVLVGFAAPSFAHAESSSKSNDKFTASTALLAAADNQFGLSVFQILNKQPNPLQNVVISPLGISLALQMAYNGAAASTKKILAERLGLGVLPLVAINHANQALMQQLTQVSPNNELHIANSLWVRPDIKASPAFLARLKTFYHSAVYPLPVASDDTANTINAWVKENTRGKITKIIDTIDANMTFLLIDAIYFHGQWAKAFDSKRTANKAFHQENNLTKLVPMMRQQSNWDYLENAYFQAVQLPYSDNKLSMFVLLPKQRLGLAGLVPYFTLANWQTWQSQFHRQEGQVELPRFAVAYETMLKPVLAQLGMNEIFDPHRANFTNMLAKGHLINLFIDDVQHKTWLEVNETGTTAAAVTATIMKTTALAQPVKPFNMTVDRPFLCVISDNQTGVIVFIGAVRTV